MKKTMTLLLSAVLALCLLAPVAPARAADSGGEVPDAPENVREILQGIAERLQSGGEDLRESLGAALEQYDTAEIAASLKTIFNDTRTMTDEELGEELRKLAEGLNISLTDGQVERLVKLCRQLEGLSEEELEKKVEELKTTAQKLGELPQKAQELGEKAQEVRESAGGFLESVKGFFSKVGDFFSGLFGGKE